MERMTLAIEYVGAPHRMLLELADMAGSNARLRHMWQRNYLRIADERVRRNRAFAKGVSV